MESKIKSKLFSKLCLLALFMSFLIISSPVAFALTISNLQITQTGPNSVKVEWDTDRDANSEVMYGQGSATEGPIEGVDDGTAHSADVLGLEVGDYKFEVSSTDTFGNTATRSTNYVFEEYADSESADTTTGATDTGADTATTASTTTTSGTTGNGTTSAARDLSDYYPPGITRVEITAVDDTSATIQTNADPSNATIRYGTSKVLLDRSLSDNAFKEIHEIKLINLQANIKYYFKAIFCDINGNCAESTIDSFTPKLDTEKPEIKSINIAGMAYYPKTRIDIFGTTKAYSEVTLTVDGKDKKIDDSGSHGNFFFPSVDLSPKATSSIKVVVKDKRGQTASQVYRLIVDPIPPRVDLFNMTSISKSKSVTIKGTVTEDVTMTFSVKQSADAAPSQVTGLELVKATENRLELKWNPATDADLQDYIVYRNGNPVTVTSATTFVDDKASKNYEYHYQISARDKTGNVGIKSDEKVFTIMAGREFNTTWPVVSLEKQTDKLEVKTRTFERALSLEEGINTLGITATDKAGNKWEQSYEILVDTIIPKVEVDSSRYTKALIPMQKISGTANKPGMTIYVEVVPKNEDGTEGEKEIYTAAASSECAGLGDGRKCPWDTMVTLQRTTGSFKATTTSGETSAGQELERASQNQITVYGIDYLETKSNVVGPWQWVYSICSFGGGVWDVVIKEIHPNVILPVLFMPDKPKPYATITLVFNYKGQGNPLKAKITPSTLSVSQRDAGPAEKEKYANVDIVQARSNAKCNSDSSVCYISINFDQRIPNMSMIDQMDKIEAPLLIKYSYTEEVRGETRQGTEGMCVDFSIQVDKRLKPGAVNKKFLRGIERIFENVVKGIDYLQKPIDMMRNLAFVGCIGSWVYMTFEQKVGRASCKFSSMASPDLLGMGFAADGQAGADPEELAARAIGYYDLDPTAQTAGGAAGAVNFGPYCAKAFTDMQTDGKVKGKTADSAAPGLPTGLNTDCMTCAATLLKLRKSEETMQMICDRTFCPTAPTLNKHSQDYSDSIAIYPTRLDGVQPKNVCEASIPVSTKFKEGELGIGDKVNLKNGKTCVKGASGGYSCAGRPEVPYDQIANQVLSYQQKPKAEAAAGAAEAATPLNARPTYSPCDKESDNDKLFLCLDDRTVQGCYHGNTSAPRILQTQYCCQKEQWALLNNTPCEGSTIPANFIGTTCGDYATPNNVGVCQNTCTNGEISVTIANTNEKKVLCPGTTGLKCCLKDSPTDIITPPSLLYEKSTLTGTSCSTSFPGNECYDTKDKTADKPTKLTAAGYTECKTGKVCKGNYCCTDAGGVFCCKPPAAAPAQQTPVAFPLAPVNTEYLCKTNFPKDYDCYTANDRATISKAGTCVGAGGCKNSTGGMVDCCTSKSGIFCCNLTKTS